MDRKGSPRGRVRRGGLTSSEDGDINGAQQTTGDTGPQDNLPSIDVKLAPLVLGTFNLFPPLWRVGKLFGDDTLDPKEGEDGSGGGSDIVSVPGDVTTGVGVVADGPEETDVGDSHQTAEGAGAEDEFLGPFDVLSGDVFGVLDLGLWGSGRHQ
jgi:hypothetical protein